MSSLEVVNRQKPPKKKNAELKSIQDGLKNQLSNEKRDPSCLGYVGDQTTQLNGDGL